MLRDLWKHPNALFQKNAYRKLEAGEEYVPVVRPDQFLPEVTMYSLLWGIFLVGIIFSRCGIPRSKNRAGI